MTKIAERVHQDQADIARLESLVADLDDEAIVEVLLTDGTRRKGTVVVRPTVQTFRDAQGNEGINGLLRLDELENPEKSHYLWLDTVAEVHHLGSA